MKNDPKFKNFYTTVNNLVLNFGTVTEDIHYFRNRLNWAPNTLDYLVKLNKNLPQDQWWKMLSVDLSQYHMQGDGGQYNVKFVSGDGHFEAVYDINGNLVTDNINMGTYNYAPVTTMGNANHGYYDVAPYYVFGNTKDSLQKSALTIELGRFLANDQYKKDKENVEKYRQGLLKNRYIEEMK